MNNKTQTIIEKVRKSLKESGIALKGIYLFGSHSKNLQTKDSDYDIAVILETSVNQIVKDEVRSVIYDIMLRYDVVIDSHIYSEPDINNAATPFRESIRTEGIFYAG